MHCRPNTMCHYFIMPFTCHYFIYAVTLHVLHCNCVVTLSLIYITFSLVMIIHAEVHGGGVCMPGECSVGAGEGARAWWMGGEGRVGGRRGQDR